MRTAAVVVLALVLAFSTAPVALADISADAGTGECASVDTTSKRVTADPENCLKGGSVTTTT